MFRTLLVLSAAILFGCRNASAECQCKSNAEPALVIDGYLPEELQTPIFNLAALNNGLTRTQIDALCNKFQAKFPDITFTYKESKQDVNAVAFGDGDTFPRHVELWGGMAKHPLMNLEGLAIILAHEVGHHYGNTDKVATNPTTVSKKYPGSDAYCEDQSDFWATRVGLRILYNDLDDFTNAHQKDDGEKYDWSVVDAEDKDEYNQKVQPGIDQAHNLLANGLFAPGQAYLSKRITEAAASFASSDCGHPLAGCRKALYESGLRKAVRASCNNALGYALSGPKRQSNASYLLEEHGYSSEAHRPEISGGAAGPRLEFTADDSANATLIKDLTDEIRALQQDVAAIRAKLDESQPN